jgi:hypothetical protein
MSCNKNRNVQQDIDIIFLLSKHASLCSVKEQLFNYIVLCFIKLQILARISSFSLLRSQYVFHHTDYKLRGGDIRVLSDKTDFAYVAHLVR